MPLKWELIEGVITKMVVDPTTHQVRQDPDTMVGGSGGSVGSLAVLRSTGTSTEALFTTNSPALRILYAWGVITGATGAGDTWKITDGTDDITDTMDCAAAADTDVVPIGQLNDAKNVLAAGASLSVVRASSCPVDVYILVAYE